MIFKKPNFHLIKCDLHLDIPYFESVIIMCTTCDVCGHKTNEVKSGCAVKDKGCKLILRIEEVCLVFFGLFSTLS